MWHLSTLTSAHHQQFHTTTYIFSFVIMSGFLLKKKSIWEKLCFSVSIWRNLLPNRIECLWRSMATMLYRTCRNWFRRFNDDNFDLSDKKHENWPRKVEDCQLQALLDEDDTQSQKMLAEQLGVSQTAISMRLHAMGKVQKIGKWVLHELNDRQMERRQNKFCLPDKKESFLHRIVAGDEKWIYFQNPKRKKSCVDSAQPSTSFSRPNRFGRKTMLCVWWDQEDVICYLLKPGETVNAHRYHQQLINLHREKRREKRPHYRKRHGKLIFLHDNAPSHTSTMVQNYLETLNWEVLPYPAYSPDLAPSDYHLFSSMGHARWAAFRFLRRCPKMAWWVVCLERRGIFLAWYTQIARKMGKMYS